MLTLEIRGAVNLEQREKAFGQWLERRIELRSLSARQVAIRPVSASARGEGKVAGCHDRTMAGKPDRGDQGDGTYAPNGCGV